MAGFPRIRMSRGILPMEGPGRHRGRDSGGRLVIFREALGLASRGAIRGGVGRHDPTPPFSAHYGPCDGGHASHFGTIATFSSVRMALDFDPLMLGMKSSISMNGESNHAI